MSHRKLDTTGGELTARPSAPAQTPEGMGARGSSATPAAMGTP
jgi:hypothetical protein